MIYLDACLVIYWVEGHSVYAPRIEQQVAKSVSACFAISPLVMTEALVLPYRQDNVALIRKFEAFFENSLILPLPEAVFIRAAELRAQYLSLKTPDALHLAAAQYHGCKAFWTNDDRLQKVVGPFAVNIGM